MAARSDALIGHLERTASIIPASGDMTVCLWVRAYGVTPAPGSYRVFYAQIDAPGTYAQYAGLYSELGTNDAGFSGDNGGGVQQTAFTATTLNQWYHLAWVQSGTSQSCYVNGSLTGSCTLNRAAVTVGVEYLLNDTFSTGDVDVAYCRQWTAALTADQIQAEMQSTTAVLNTGDYMDCPFETDALDISGFGHDWTTVGSITYVPQPTFATNGTIDTAIALGTTPQSLTLDMGSGSEAWYSYTPRASTEIVLGFWAFYDFTKVDNLLISVYQGPTSAPVAWPTTDTAIAGADSVPYQIPLTYGTTIYIKLAAKNLAALPFTSTIAISTLPGPTSAAPIGSIVVNDDLAGFPMAILSSTTGTPLQFSNVAPGGSGAVMPVTGQLFLQNENLGQLSLYNADLSLIANIAYPEVGSSSFNIPSIQSQTDGSATFYSTTDAVSTHTKLHAYNLSGAVTGTWTLTQSSVRAGAVNRDNTIFYYVTSGVATNMHRWDLVNDVALADLVTGTANYTSGVDLLYLGDGTLVNYYHRNGFPDLVKNLDATTGATIHTYTMAASPAVVDHLTPAIDDPNSFWVWMHNGASATYASTFLNVKVSDGTLLTNLNAQQFEQGQYGGDWTVAPTDRFGHSNSCPFWISRVAVGSPITTSGDPVEYLIRRERIFPVISKEQHRLFFSKLQLYFEAGVGLSTGQGSDPIVELDWSDDGGHTWSNLHLIQTGKQGQYKWRAMKWNMGSARERLYRVAVTDPVQWTLIDAFLELTEGLS